jgi:hypothetical protein
MNNELLTKAGIFVRLSSHDRAGQSSQESYVELRFSQKGPQSPSSVAYENVTHSVIAQLLEAPRPGARHGD